MLKNFKVDKHFRVVNISKSTEEFAIVGSISKLKTFQC